MSDCAWLILFGSMFPFVIQAFESLVIVFNLLSTALIMYKSENTYSKRYKGINPMVLDITDISIVKQRKQMCYIIINMHDRKNDKLIICTT